MSTKEQSDNGDDAWIRVKSGAFSFLVKKKVLLRSGTMKDMMSGDFQEMNERTVNLTDSARPIVTEKVLEYLAYKTTYEKAGPKEEIPDFYERVMPELALELLTAADYLAA
ncbi:hypothetical protein PENSPDRAFT_619078 [Peniophora sp. CONT]|nr:hypothetical protein PENSPDRAFT_619078 [Peniophora sp. CONT]